MRTFSIDYLELALNSENTFRRPIAWIVPLSLWPAVGLAIAASSMAFQNVGTLLDGDNQPSKFSSPSQFEFVSHSISELSTFYATMGIVATLLVALQVAGRSYQQKLASYLNQSRTLGSIHAGPHFLENQKNRQLQNDQVAPQTELLDQIDDLDSIQGHTKILWLIVPVFAYWIAATWSGVNNESQFITVFDPAAFLVICCFWMYGIVSEKTLSIADYRLLSEARWRRSIKRAASEKVSSHALRLAYDTFDIVARNNGYKPEPRTALATSAGLIGIFCSVIVASPYKPPGMLDLLAILGTSLLVAAILTLYTSPMARAYIFTRHVYYSFTNTQVLYNVFREPINFRTIAKSSNFSTFAHRSTESFISRVGTIVKYSGNVNTLFCIFMLLVGSLINMVSTALIALYRGYGTLAAMALSATAVLTAIGVSTFIARRNEKLRLLSIISIPRDNTLGG